MDLIKLLIVGGMPGTVVDLEAVLRRSDIELITATSANDALRICWEQDIAIALIDVETPQMGGFELVEIFKSNPKTQEMLVVFMTALSTESKYVVEGLSMGAIDFLYKPIDPYIAAAKVDAFIKLVRSQREVKHKNEELERYQQELITAKDQALQGKQSKESFLANMSHEIRTPLHGIVGLIQLLENSDLEAEQRKMIELLRVSSESLLGVINDILDFSKIEAGKFKIVRAETKVSKVVKSVTGLLKSKADEKGLALNVLIEKDVPDYIVADSLRLNQILLNLLSNAIKFTHKGVVALTVRMAGRKEEKVRLDFIVEDTGIGIAAAKLEKIFETFEQANESIDRKFGGTGLGLSIVKQLAALMGGDVSVESEEGAGSKFVFSNWFRTAAVVPGEHRENGDVLARFENVRVLVAEDNTVSQFMINKILKRWNVDVDIVDNGQKVLEKISEEKYDLILMDTYMPVMGGFEATRLIRNSAQEDLRSLPIISLSASVLEDEKQEAFTAGVNDVLGKPFDLLSLHRAIDKYRKRW